MPAAHPVAKRSVQRVYFFGGGDLDALASALAVPLAAGAQQTGPSVHTVGILAPHDYYRDSRVQKPGQIASLAQKSRLPSMYGLREFADAGGLMAYGPNYAEGWRRAATYVDKILKGAKPGELPVEQPTKFELVINLMTAKALGLTIPPSLLRRADQVIE